MTEIPIRAQVMLSSLSYSDANDHELTVSHMRRWTLGKNDYVGEVRFEFRGKTEGRMGSENVRIVRTMATDQVDNFLTPLTTLTKAIRGRERMDAKTGEQDIEFTIPQPGWIDLGAVEHKDSAASYFLEARNDSDTVRVDMNFDQLSAIRSFLMSVSN